MGEYVKQMRADGLPADAWLRTHVRVGGRIVKVAPCSMTIVGTVAEWSRWTGTTFARSGAIVVAARSRPSPSRSNTIMRSILSRMSGCTTRCDINRADALFACRHII
jgi:hypothetical protein